MRPGRDSPDERFAAYVRERGEPHYQRLCRAAIGSPGHSCMARRLSRAG